MGAFVRVLSASEVPAKTNRAVTLDGKSILICHTKKRFYAISGVCTHAEESLACGRMSESWVACPVHGARFELATGKVLRSPALKPLATYEIRVVDGWIEVLV